MSWKPFTNQCARIEPLLWEYAGNRLPFNKRARIEAHLKRCVFCQAQLKTYVQIGQGLEALRTTAWPATQTGWHEVRARLSAVQNAPPLPQKVTPGTDKYRFLLGGAICAAVTLCCFLIVPRGGELQAPLEEKGTAKAGNSYAEGLKIASSEGYGEKSFVALKTPFVASADQPDVYESRPAPPQLKLSTVSLRSEDVSDRQAFRVRRRRRFASRPDYLRRYRHGLLANNASVGTESNSAETTSGPDMIAQSGDRALSQEVPNYVLTGMEAGSERPAPRTYVMDCVSTNPQSASGTNSGPTGEDERVW